MKTLVVGAGKMTEALLSGLASEVDMREFYIYSASGESAKRLSKNLGATFLENLNQIQDPSYVWIGCKPQQLKNLAKVIYGKFPNATYISMLAALREREQLNLLGINQLVRIMPNLSVKQKKGIILMSSFSAREEMVKLNYLFSLIGDVFVLKEEELEELTLLTGSGPALFYEFTKCLANCFSSLNSDQREKLARMVLLGAGISSSKSSQKLQSMINDVTSKGGVTIEILNFWKTAHFDDFLRSGIEAGKRKTEEIKKSILEN